MATQLTDKERMRIAYEAFRHATFETCKELAKDFYKTKVVIEIDVMHQSDPKQGIDIILQQLKGATAITFVNVLSAESNFQLHDKPADTMSPVNLR